MKLSSHTTSVLKNFATINQNLVIKEGNTIATMSAMKNIVAKAEVEETFPMEVAIYDLNEFLGALSLFTSPVCLLTFFLPRNCDTTFSFSSSVISPNTLPCNLKF